MGVADALQEFCVRLVRYVDDKVRRDQGWRGSCPRCERSGEGSGAGWREVESGRERRKVGPTGEKTRRV